MIQNNNNYVYGTAAKKIEYDVYEQNKVLKEKKNYKSNIAIKAKIIVCIGVLFLFALVVMHRYTQITDMNYRLSGLEKQYEELRNENSRLKLAIEKQTNLSRIMQVAQENLGMQKPDKYQIVHIRVPKVSYTVAFTDYEKTRPKQGFMAGLIPTVENIKKIFD